MNDKDLKESAKNTYLKGFNCSEAIVAFFSGKYSLNLNPRFATAMGAGIGGAKNLCGALNGAVLVLGAIFGRDDPSENSAEVYKMSAEFIRRFEENLNTTLCSEITSDIEWKTPAHKDLCSGIVAEAAAILDEIIKEKKELMGK